MKEKSKEYKKNCFFCDNLGSDDDGSDFSTKSWPICDKNMPKSNLKSFPFEKEQPCHVPSFWQVLSVDKEMSKAFDADDKDEDDWTNWESMKIFKRKYLGGVKQ